MDQIQLQIEALNVFGVDFVITVLLKMYFSSKWTEQKSKVIILQCYWTTSNKESEVIFIWIRWTVNGLLDQSLKMIMLI